MGIKHPDQISPSHWREAAETVQQMFSKRWELTARCRACQVVTLVDLRVVAGFRGRDFSLWNKHTRCRCVVFNGRCPGFVDFAFKAPGMTTPKPLAASDRAAVAPRGHVERAFADERTRQAQEGKVST